MSTRAWILLIVAVCLAMGGWWAVENLTIEEVRIPGRPKGEVLRNPFFATQKLMQEQGARVEARYGHRGAPSGTARGSVLFIPTERRTLSATHVQELLDWVRAGGHLVLVAYPPASAGSAPDPLLKAVGVTVQAVRSKRPYKAEAERAEGEELPDEDTASTLSEDDPADRDLQRWFPMLAQGRTEQDCLAHAEAGSEGQRFSAQWMRLCFSPYVRLRSEKEPLWAVHARDDIHAITHALGQGRVSAITSQRMLQSIGIADGDHAEFLAALLGGRFSGLNITLVVRDDVDNLAVLAWEHGAAVVIALVLFILAWLWWAATRIGPVVQPAMPERRSVLEHVRALGEFFWRERTPHVLWQATAERTRKDIARKVPRFTSDQSLAAHLSRRTGLAEPDVLFALNPGDVTDPQAFVRAIATLEHLRKSL